MDWRERAACKGKTKVFFPGENEGCLAAKTICSGCPVYGPCRREALDLMPEYGVQAGMTRGERAQARRRLAVA